MDTPVPTHRQLSPLQMIGIILIANNAVRILANRPPAPIVRNVVDEVVVTSTDK